MAWFSRSAHALAIFSFFLASCSGGSSSTSNLDTSVPDGSLDGAAVDVMSDGSADGSADAKPDLGAGLDADAHGADQAFPPQDTVAQEEIGTACETDADCPNGLCVEGDEGKVCAASCTGGCPQGWSCKTEDENSYCVPSLETLCSSCSQDAECGGDEDLCVASGPEVANCAVSCASAADCPAGYSCDASLSVDGVSQNQCVAINGTCDCTEENAGATRGCAQSNGFGTCSGEEYCDPEQGWIGCSAWEPAAESCDGADNDCNGAVDEGFVDSDLDGKPDCLDFDADNDGFPDVVDNCETQFNPNQDDLDGDGLGDACDPDDDGDSVPDGIDNCVRLSNAGQADYDEDGVGDLCDDDMDGDDFPNTLDCQPLDHLSYPGADEICDAVDNNCNTLVDEGFPDSDADGVNDCVDDDDDNDGDPDENDCSPLNPHVYDGAQELCDGIDNSCEGDTDEGFPDLDQDGIMDCVEDDTDGDGDPDTSDCAVLDPAVNSGAMEGCDGVDNNCNSLVDEGFPDSDTDGLKDCVDEDDDNDLTLDDDDCAPFDPSIHALAEDVCDGVDNNCDNSTDEGHSDVDQDGVADCMDLDNDNDGVEDELDNCPVDANGTQENSDTDLMGDACDPDDDNDTVLDGDDNCPVDPNMDQEDQDLDNAGDACDEDDDNDGIEDTIDNCPLDSNAEQENLDGDGQGDPCDLDDDNDGTPDLSDNCPLDYNPTQVDSDDNGVGDHCEGGTAGQAFCGNGVLEGGEECDDGQSNSDFAPDSCRTNCMSPSCGDGVTDGNIGELCDDGNSLDNDGCNGSCAISVIEGLTLPYTQNFDEQTSFYDVYWLRETDLASQGNNWEFTELGDLGDDVHPRFRFFPIVESFTDSIVTPVLDATGASHVTLTFETEFLVAQADPDLKVSVLTSSNAGVSWTEQWSHSAEDGSIPVTSLNVDLSAGIAGEPISRVAFRISGATSGSLAFWDIDDVQVRPGAAPVLDPIEDIQAFSGETTQAAVSVVDADTDLTSLNYSLNNAPAYVSVTTLSDGSPSIVISPGPTEAGATAGVELVATDGTFTHSQTFDLLVVAPPIQAGPPAKLVIRDAPGGGGAPVGDVDLELGESISLYAAGYDSEGLYTGDQAVFWEATGTLEAVSEGPTSSVVFAPALAGTSGTIAVSLPDLSIEGDATGAISVVLPPPGEVSASLSTVGADRNFLIADGVDNMWVHAWLFDDQGQPLEDEKTAVFEVTLGVLTGDVIYDGAGHYKQQLVSVVEEGTAILSVVVDETPLNQTVSINMAALDDLVQQGVTAINCDNYLTYKGRNLLVRAGTVAFDATEGCSPMEFGSILVDEGGVITHSAVTSEVVYRVDLVVANLTVASGSCIDVNAKGYPPSYGYLNTQEWGSSGNAGGSHGGLGAQHSGTAGPSYGRIDNPSEPGAGAGAGSVETAGGGVVRVVVSEDGFLVVNGCIKANGGNTWNVQGGAAGGSIYLDTPHVSGAGIVSANGGNGHGSINYKSGGGGGGRIAVVNFDVALDSFASDVIDQNVEARGGSGYDTEGGAGTIFFRGTSDTYGSLIVDNEGLETAPGSTPLPTLPEGSVDTVTGSTLYDAGVELVPGFYIGTRINPDVTQGDVPTLIDDQHFVVLSNDSTSITAAGDLETFTAALKTYRGMHVYDHLKIRGKAKVSTTGDILVTQGDLDGSEDVFDVEGGLEVNILDLTAIGSIRVSSGALSVQELVTAGVSDYPFVIELEDATYARPEISASSIQMVDSVLSATNTIMVSGNLTVDGGQVIAQALVAQGTVDIEGASVTFGTIDVDEDLLIGDDATVTVSDDWVTVGGLVKVGGLTGGANLTHAPADSEKERALVVNAGSLTVHTGSSINVSGRGYQASGEATQLSVGNNGVYGAQTRCGGSHAGVGDCNVSVARSHGDYRAPRSLGGAGGKYSGAYLGGNGGGRVELNIDTFVTLDGSIEAAGNSSNRGGGGAGGSILIRAQHLGGSGTLRVNGGSGSSVWESWGGGGGRVAIRDWDTATGVFGADVPADSVLVFGASGEGGCAGSGTYYRHGKDEPWGILVVDNQSCTTWADSTPLNGVGSGLVQILDSVSLTDGSAQWFSSELTSQWVNPNVNQGGPSLKDDVIVPITGNTGTVLQVGDGVFAETGIISSNVLDVAQLLDTYREIHVFRQVDVRGNAQLFTEGDILILEGDVGSNDPGTFVVGGEIKAHTLDLNQVNTIELAGGGLFVDVLISNDVADHNFVWTGTGSTLTLKDVHASSLNLSNVAIDADNINVTGAAVFDSVTGSFATITTGEGLQLIGTSNLSVVQDTVTVGGELYLGGTATLGHTPCTTDDVNRLEISANSVVIDNNASINVNGRGYKSTAESTHGWQNKVEFGSSTHSGGSHGGVGGNTSGIPYGRYWAPDEPGGGGGRYNGAYLGGDGGGVVRIQATTSVAVHGAIHADGAQGNRGGGGAGGSVYISCVGLSGDGSITARGADGSHPYNTGSGGGGRIAVVDFQTLEGAFALPQLHVGFLAHGRSAAQDGGAGTIFLRNAAQEHGDLIIDNHGVGGTTELLAPPPGVVFSHTSATFVRSGETWEPDYYAGYLINPNGAQGAAGLLGDTLFEMASHTETTVTIASGDLSAVMVDGDTYRGVALVLNNLQIGADTAVTTDGDVLVHEGDLFSYDSKTFALPEGASVTVGWLELPVSTTTDISGGTLSYEELFCLDCP